MKTSQVPALANPTEQPSQLLANLAGPTVFAHHREIVQPPFMVEGLAQDQPQQMNGLACWASCQPI